MGTLLTTVTTRQPLRTQLPRSRQQRCVALLLDLDTAARSVKQPRCYLAGGLGKAAHSVEEVGSSLVGREEQEAGLSSSHQALLLGQAGLVLKGTSGDELRHWRMAPYLDAVLQQKRSRFMIRLSAQLLR